MSIELPLIEARSEYYFGVKITSASEKKYGYAWVVRDNKSHPWKQVAHCWVTRDAWMRYNVNKHLKSVGIN